MLNWDYNATAPLCSKAIEAVEHRLRQVRGNPSSVHALGRSTRESMDRARRSVARALGASPSQVVFTSGGTEALVRGMEGALGPYWNGNHPPHVVFPAGLHDALRSTLGEWIQGGRIRGTEIPLNEDGEWSVQDFVASVDSETRLVCVLHSHNETGVLFPIAELRKAIPTVPILVDAVQSFGKVDVSFESLGVEFLAISGHKAGALTGIGALFIRSEAEFHALHGGGGQERGRRGGTENISGIISLAAVAEGIAEGIETFEAVSQERDRFEAAVLALGGTRVVSSKAPRLPNTSLVLFKGLQGDDLQDALEILGVVVGTGSACSSHKKESSTTLRAMGYSAEESHSAVRFSMPPHLSSEDVDQVFSLLEMGLESLRQGVFPVPE